MRVDRLRLSAYRNIPALDLALGEGVTVLEGDNAQGKTNLLEAVLVMTLGRSHRTLKEKDFIQEGKEQAVIRVDITRRDGPHALRMVIPRNTPRSLRIDGHATRNIGEIMGRLNAVLFSPEDLRVVKDGPDVRRRFINREISQMKPAYFSALQRYARALHQRQLLLRKDESPQTLSASLDVWDEQLAREGTYVIQSRRFVLRDLSERCAKWHALLSDGKEELRLEYRPSIEAEAPSVFMERLMARRLADLATRQTALGPHRDDIAVVINGREARTFASQGQQRTAVLALRLSEVELIREVTGETPVLMLDDVFSELDPTRRGLLLSSLHGAQTLVTCTDAAEAAELRGARLIRVENGRFYEK